MDVEKCLRWEAKEAGTDLFKQFLSLADGGLAQLAVDAARVVNQLLEIAESLLSGREGLLGTSVLLVAEVIREGGAGPAETEAPALKCSGLVGEAGEVAFRFHELSEPEDMTREAPQSNLKMVGMLECRAGPFVRLQDWAAKSSEIWVALRRDIALSPAPRDSKSP